MISGREWEKYSLNVLLKALINALFSNRFPSGLADKILIFV